MCIEDDHRTFPHLFCMAYDAQSAVEVSVLDYDTAVDEVLRRLHLGEPLPSTAAMKYGPAAQTCRRQAESRVRPNRRYHTRSSSTDGDAG